MRWALGVGRVMLYGEQSVATLSGDASFVVPINHFFHSHSCVASAYTCLCDSVVHSDHSDNQDCRLGSRKRKFFYCFQCVCFFENSPRQISCHADQLAHALLTQSRLVHFVLM